MTSNSNPNGKTPNGTHKKLDADATLIKSLQALIEKTGASDEDADADLEVLLHQLNAANDVADSVEGRIDSILENLDEVLRSFPSESGPAEAESGEKRPETEQPGSAEKGNEPKS